MQFHCIGVSINVMYVNTFVVFVQFCCFIKKNMCHKEVTLTLNTLVTLMQFIYKKEGKPESSVVFAAQISVRVIAMTFDKSIVKSITHL